MTNRVNKYLILSNIVRSVPTTRTYTSEFLSSKLTVALNKKSALYFATKLPYSSSVLTCSVLLLDSNVGHPPNDLIKFENVLLQVKAIKAEKQRA